MFSCCWNSFIDVISIYLFVCLWLIHFNTDITVLFFCSPFSLGCRSGGGRPGGSRSLQVVWRGHCPAAHCRRGAAPQPVLCVWCGLHPGASGNPLPETGHAGHPAYRGRRPDRCSLSSHWNQSCMMFFWASWKMCHYYIGQVVSLLNTLSLSTHIFMHIHSPFLELAA